MDILDKLSAVSIDQDSRITAADRTACEAHQQAYYEAKSDIEKLYSLWNEMTQKQEELLFEAVDSEYSRNRYIRIDGIKDYEFTEKLEVLPVLFISGISSYFSRTYNVDINTDKLEEMLLPKAPDRYVYNEKQKKEYRQKLREMKLTYQDVLKHIFTQFEGKGFTEVAISQIKAEAHKGAWDTYNGKPKYEVKNCTIKFSGYFCTVSEYSYSYSLTGNMKDVLRAAALFETNEVGKYSYYIAKLLGYSSENYPEVTFHDCEKLASLKMYKNGRVDLKFSSKNEASDFAENYLGSVC